jgi:hypothetical protein
MSGEMLMTPQAPIENAFHDFTEKVLHLILRDVLKSADTCRHCVRSVPLPGVSVGTRKGFTGSNTRTPEPAILNLEPNVEPEHELRR